MRTSYPKPMETMERITRQFLCDHFDEILERVDKEDIGFVILNEEGSDGEVLIPYRWTECFADEDFGFVVNSALRYAISGTGMNSLNHYSYGSVVEFLYRYAAGIQPLEPGFRKAKIAPNPEIRLGHLECSYDSICGKYVSNWKIETDGRLFFHIEIPFGCKAEVTLPEQAMQTLTAGSYDFTVETEKDYRALFSATTPYERLFEDERAAAVLKKYLPEVYYGTDRKDEEAMSKCLNDSKSRASLFRTPTENYEKAIEEICTIQA